MAKSATQKKDINEMDEFEKLLEQSYQSSVPKEGDIIQGTIVRVSKDDVIVDVGLKSEGRVNIKEFYVLGEPTDIKPGDVFNFYLEKFEDKEGEIILSREKAVREEAWKILEIKFEKGENVEGVVFGTVKGGFTVDVDGAVAFLPGSQVDIKPVKDINALLGIRQPFQILKMDKKRGNIVVSRRAIMEESNEEIQQKIDQVNLGDVITGMVKNITEYGAFIDLGGFDGLLHVTDISWKRVNHPSEVMKVGEKVKVTVTKIDNGRISLGMKQMESSPWEAVQGQLKVGARFKGPVTNIADYGIFVEVIDGIEGLVHVSEMSWVKKNVNPSQVVTLGDEVEVEVIELDLDKCRISLGMKQCMENPWEKFANKNNVDDIIQGKVRNITDFGLFVELDGDIDGLVHYSDISWDDEKAIQNYKKGDVVKAKILVIDAKKERIALGIKQLSDNPNASSMEGLRKGAAVTVEVLEIKSDGIEVKVNENINSLIKRADLSREKQEQRPERFAVGNRIDATIIGVEPKKGVVKLSIKQLEIDEHKKAIAEYGSSASGASLGDILGAAIEAQEGKKSKK